MSGQSDRPKVFDENAGPIAVRAGERFVIELKGIPGAGYQWLLAPGPLADLVEQEVTPATAVGGAASFRFHLQAKSAGSGTITAEYRRFWEDQAQQKAAFALTVAKP